MTKANAAGVKGRLATVQALRFFAALLVVVYHAQIFAFEAAVTLPSWPSTETIATVTSIGRSGVPIFFVISGFIMLHGSYARFAEPGAPVTFALNRAVRIYPLYWVMIAAWLVTSSDARLAFPFTFSEFSAMILLLPGGADRVVTVAWTLAFEMYFYAVFAVALLFPRSIGLALITVTLLSGILAGKVFGWSPTTPSGEALYGVELSLFLAGMVIALLARRLQGDGGGWSIGLRWMFLAAGIGWLLATPWMRDAGLPAVLAYGPAAIILVAGAVFSDVTGRTSPVAHRFAFLGDSSYSLYLVHIPVMILATPALIALAQAIGLGQMGLIILLSAVSVVAGHIVYLLAERPMQRWFHARLSQTAKRPLAP